MSGNVNVGLVGLGYWGPNLARSCAALPESELGDVDYICKGVDDVVFCYLRFPSGLAAHLHLSWLDPRSDGAAGVRVVRVLEELLRSLDSSTTEAATH